MSETSNVVTKKRKRVCNSASTIDRKRIDTNVNFIFQDETKVSIPLFFVKNHPKSVLFLTYECPNSYIEDEDAYYIDHPPLSMDKSIQYLQNTISLKSCNIDEVIDIYNNLKFYFYNETVDYQLQVFDFLTETLNLFAKENDCKLYRHQKYFYNSKEQYYLYINGIINESRNKLFLQYSRLFKFLNVTKVSLDYDLLEDIPYEYIYPSNLLEIFPELESYTIGPSYYPKQKDYIITKTDRYYHSLYSHYKLLCHKKYSPAVYDAYVSMYSREERDDLFDPQLEMYIPDKNENNDKSNDKNENENKNKNKNDDKNENKNDDKKDNKNDENDDENNDKNNDKNNYNDIITNDLFNIFAYHDFLDFCASQNNHYFYTMFQTPYDESDIPDNPFEAYKNYIQAKNINIYEEIRNGKEEDKPDIILQSKSHYNREYNEEQMKLNNKEIKKVSNTYSFDFKKDNTYKTYDIQFEFPPFLRLLREGFFDSIQIMDIFSYSINCSSTVNAVHDILSLISKEHFPRLSIYDTCTLGYYNQELNSMFDLLLPISLLLLVDTISIDNDCCNSYPKINENIANTFISINKTHKLIIKINFRIIDYNELWKQLYDNKMLDLCLLDLRFDHNYENNDDLSLLGFNSCPFDKLKIFATSDACKQLYKFENTFQKMNYNNLKDIEISRFYADFYKRSPIILNEEITDIFFQFFSLFSNNLHEVKFECPFISAYFLLNDKCKKMKIWSTIQKLTLYLDETISLKDVFINLLAYINNNQFSNLETLEINIEYTEVISFSDLNMLIDLWHNASPVSLPYWHGFRILTKEIMMNIDFFECFPSIYNYLHIPLVTFDMRYMKQKGEMKKYSEYIYNQLKMEYTKNIRYLQLFFLNKGYMTKFVRLITKGTFPYLKELKIITLKNKEPKDFDGFKQLLNEYKMTKNLQLTIKYCLED
ncbi:hypothetical protein WA158_006417 [Blastocystis sp. Blastoise]